MLIPVPFAVAITDKMASDTAAPTEESSKESVEFCEGLPEEYYKQLTAEELQIKETKNGSLKHQWVKTYQANEALDTLTNNLGLHTILFANYSEDRWKGLERS